MTGDEQEQVAAALDRALASGVFRQSERQSRLLRYLVEKTLANEVVKETIIGIDLYGKKGEFEPKSDSIVRVEASRLRQRLANYYASEGKDERVWIELPRGGYRCSFEWKREEAAPAEVVVPVAEAPAEEVKREDPPVVGRTWRGWWIALAALCGMAAVVWWWGARGTQATDSIEEDLPSYLEAHRLMKMPVDAGTPRRLGEAVRLLQLATRERPGSARAHAGLAQAYLSLSDYEGSRFFELNKMAEDAARAAIRLNPGLDDAHHELGAVLFLARWRFREALGEFTRAVELNPRRSHSHRLRSEVLCVLGRFEEAVEALRHAQVLEPADVEIVTEKAMVFYHWRRYEEAAAEASRALSLRPGHPMAAWVLAMVDQRKGRLPEAEKGFRSLPPRPSRGLLSLAHLLASTGREREAREILAKIKADRPYPYGDALLEAALGNRKEATVHLEAAWSRHDLNIPYMHLDPRFDGLREEPGFRKIVNELGLGQR